jgi:pyruvate formate lyase activating enzyme
MEIDAVLRFAERLAAHKRPVWLRYVLVPGWSDHPAEIEGVAKFAAGLGVVRRVDVLPFHQMGRYKWDALKLDYRLRDTKEPTAVSVESACAVFRAAGLKAY